MLKVPLLVHQRVVPVLDQIDSDVLWFPTHISTQGPLVYDGYRKAQTVSGHTVYRQVHRALFTPTGGRMLFR